MTGPLAMMLTVGHGTSKPRSALSELQWTGIDQSDHSKQSGIDQSHCRFNNRRYNKLNSTNSESNVVGDLDPVDNCINSVLGQVSDSSSLSNT